MRTPGFLRASKWRLAAVPCCVCAGRHEPSGAKLSVLKLTKEAGDFSQVLPGLCPQPVRSAMGHCRIVLIITGTV
jgi:hypothetical protein